MANAQGIQQLNTVMANYTALAKDPHSITIIDAADGSYYGTLYVTSGQIIGQPLVSPQTIVVSYQEAGHTYMNTYATETRAFVQRVQIG